MEGQMSEFDGGYLISKQIVISSKGGGNMEDNEFNAIFRSIGEELEGYSLYGTYVDLSQESEQGDEVSSNFQMEVSNHTQPTNQTKTNDVKPKAKGPSAQSSLHNCPKHLIGFVNQALDLRQLQDLDQNQFLASVPEQIRPHLKGLLKIIIYSHRGQIRSMSRELLKIVFETKSETLIKLRLLDNPYVRQAFQASNLADMTRAKAILRQRTIDMLGLKKRKLLAESRINNKAVNKRYLDLFIRQLGQDRIRERITKKEKILIAGLRSEKP